NINNVRAKEGVTTGSSKSYVHAVKVKTMFRALECDSKPSIVLDDECLISKDLSKALLGRENIGVGSSFSVLKQASSYFIPEGRIVWVEIEGIPFKLWSNNTFKWIAAKWGELLDVDDQEEEGFHSKRLCIYSKSGTNIYENFKVIFRGKVFLIRAKEVPGWVPEFVDDSDDDDDESDNGFKDGDAKNKDKSENMKPSNHSLKYPPGFTPNGDNDEFCMHDENVQSVNEANSLNCNVEENQNGQERNSTNMGSKEENSGSVCSKLDGFNKFVIDMWNLAPIDESNAMRNVMIKLKFLKRKIREWLHDNRNKSKSVSDQFKEELQKLDADIDKGIGSIQHLDKIQAMDVAQKAKIKWAIEGDENTRQFWSSIENDVFAAVSHFFTFGDIPNGCNSCFIDLIPKVPDANLVKDFRPISLIRSMYKIIAKILKNRLVGVLWDIVNEVQSAFITGRQILDGPFILNEVIQWCKLKKKQSLIFKVDFEKAYDSVRWDFLDDVLKKFGFGNKWCAWIQSCLRSSRGSIIINGSHTQEFQFFKGLKQGDPLSSFLFILIMESLHLSFQRVMDVGMFKGINLSPLVNLSHMFYADDVVFVGQWCDGNINTLVHVLECFFQASGLRINMCKSKIMGVNVGDEKVKSTASKLGCLILNTPFYYLGTKVRGNMSRVQAWTKVVDKASWVKWKSVLAFKEKGGLGVSSLSALNRALMMKWVWMFYSQKESLWVRVIKAIYDYDGQVGKVSKVGSRSCWRNIVNEVRILSNQSIKVLDYMWIKLGNEESTAFWDDNWIGGKVLMYSFPRIYALETDKEVTINSKMSDTRLENSFRRSIRGGVEQVQFNELSDMLQSVSLMPYSDIWVWSLEGSREFSAASIRKIIDDNRLSTVDTRTLWIKYVPIKVNVLAWKIKIEALPTKFNISRRGGFPGYMSPGIPD
nr:RNA-directed DNA polymerase, eukaryota, reverse transcriptase zinc-binding domain protein [Tanacetum cinerariifolium]